MCTSQAEAAQVQVLRYSTKALTQLGLRAVSSPVQAAQVTRSFTSALSSGAVRLLPSPSQPQFLGEPGPGCLVSLLGS